MAKPAIQGTCCCGAVRLEVARKPRKLTQCNCSVCRRYGTLWAYYTEKSVSITAARGALVSYSVRPGGLRFVHCATCGCVIRWARRRKGPDERMGLNARLLDPEAVAHIPIEVLDGDRTWKILDEYVKPDIFRSPHRG
jgi:hypothetical protein